MPLYEYACETCGHPLTQHTAMELRNEVPDCDCGGKMVRLFSVPQVIVQRDAADVLNRAAAGEGDPVPGQTREETRRGAVALARSHKEGSRSRRA